MEEKAILFITDIHQKIDNLRAIDFNLFDAVICAGDIIDPANQSVDVSLDILSILPEDTYLIPGNCDTDLQIYNKILSMKNCIERKKNKIFDINIGGIGKSRALEDDIEIYRDYFISDKNRITSFIKSGGSPFILKYVGVDADKRVIDNKNIISDNKTFFDKFISFKESDLFNVFKTNDLLNGILVTHSPPYGFLDKLPGLPHIGSHGVMECINIAKPSLILSGHFHELTGIIIEKNMTFFNPGALKDGFYGIIKIMNNKYDCSIHNVNKGLK